MRNNNICIIAVGYNRPLAMERLLASLASSQYFDAKVDLLISIDKGPNQKEVIDVAEKFVWEHGTKNIRAFQERQGLRSHILQCGDIVMDYDAVVVLEDDVEVSNCFYSYVCSCLNEYETDSRIAGISLYKHVTNVCGGYFFEPDNDEYDAYLMQYAQSWGQCWSKRMWSDFKRWYEANSHRQLDPNTLPYNVINWNEHSWLKYFIAYVVENDLYFVYPRIAQSTNNSDVGQHCDKSNNAYQVSLANHKHKYLLPSFDTAIKYDAFFERQVMVVSGYDDKRVIIDLYGNKVYFDDADILISIKPRPYKILDSWQLKYRPQEQNLIRQVPGNEIFVYDLHTSVDVLPPIDETSRTQYDCRAIERRKLLALGMRYLIDAIKRKLKS